MVVHLKDRIKNENINPKLGMAPIEEKMKMDVERTSIERIVGKSNDLEVVDTSRRRGKP